MLTESPWSVSRLSQDIQDIMGIVLGIQSRKSSYWCYRRWARDTCPPGFPSRCFRGLSAPLLYWEPFRSGLQNKWRHINQRTTKDRPVSPPCCNSLSLYISVIRSSQWCKFTSTRSWYDWMFRVLPQYGFWRVYKFSRRLTSIVQIFWTRLYAKRNVLKMPWMIRSLLDSMPAPTCLWTRYTLSYSFHTYQILIYWD